MRHHLLLAALLAPAVASAVPTKMAHQGRLFDAGGAAVDGDQSVTFSLYASDTSTDALWTETQDVSFEDGYFAVILGSVSPVAPTAFDGEAPWVGMSVGGVDTGLRLPLTSVPYAFRADTATNLVGGTVDATSILVNGTTVFADDGTIAWSSISGAPDDMDTLGDLVCADGEVPTWQGSFWACGTVGSGSVDVGDLVGTIAITNLPVGSGPNDVAPGDHTHSFGQITGELGLDRTLGTLAADRIADLDAAKITSGTFDAARIPDLDAAKITSGAFDAARIPNLDAAKIATGTFNAARIPDLDAAKITTGTVNIARLPTGTGATQVALGNHTHTAASVGALPLGGGTLTGGLTGTTATFSGAITANGGIVRACTGGNARVSWTSGGGANGHCYARFDGGLSFYNAQLACEVWGGYLVNVGSAAENSFLQANLAVPATTWLGTSDARNEGIWDNVGGQQMVLGSDSISYRNWNAGEPNNSGNEDCAHMYQNGTWNDAGCAATLPYICERDW